MSAIQAAIEKMKNNRSGVKNIVALMLRICDIHNLKEAMAELSSDACERKEHTENTKLLSKWSKMGLKEP